MNRHRFRPMMDAGQALDFPPGGIFGMAGGKFLSHLKRNDDFSDDPGQDTQSTWQHALR